MTAVTNINPLKNPSSSDFFILDIDSTLVTTYQRNQAIIQKFISLHKAQFPEDCLALKQAKCQLGDYGIETCLKRIQFKATDLRFSEILHSYWRENFFSNNFLHADQPVEGAVKWVQFLKTCDIDFIYLTARHKDTMWDGTLSSLKNLGFPISEKNLFLKEDLADKDEEYKAKVLASVIDKKNGKNVFFIDNEPLVLNAIQDNHPSVRLVWFNSTHAGKSKPPNGITTIKNFIF